MERLTLDEIIKLVNEAAVQMEIDNCKECSENYKKIAEYLEELKSYKEAEEQGLLVRLPCKIGEKLWCIVNSAIRELRVHHFDMPAFGTTDIVFRYADGFKLERFVGTLGETVFLTREKAEKKLEEMKNDGE